MTQSCNFKIAERRILCQMVKSLYRLKQMRNMDIKYLIKARIHQK